MQRIVFDDLALAQVRQLQEITKRIVTTAKRDLRLPSPPQAVPE